MSLIVLTSEKELENIKGKMVIDFYAEWCGPCKMFKNIFTSSASKHEDIPFVKVDVDKFPSLASKYRVMSIPTVILADNEKELQRSVGFMSEEALEAFIK